MSHILPTQMQYVQVYVIVLLPEVHPETKNLFLVPPQLQANLESTLSLQVFSNFTKESPFVIRRKLAQELKLWEHLQTTNLFLLPKNQNTVKEESSLTMDSQNFTKNFGPQQEPQ